MGRIYSLKNIILIFLVCFGLLVVSPDPGFAQQDENVLFKARRLYQQGYYDDAIKLLNEYIEKIKSVAEQKKNVARAFYQLAKVYYTVGEDKRVEENLKKVFRNYPDFQVEETDVEFLDRVAKVRRETRVGTKKEEPAVKKTVKKAEAKKTPEPVATRKQEIPGKSKRMPRRKIAFGLKGGAGLTHIAGDMSFHFELGGSIKLPLSGKISLVPELFYYNNPNEEISHIKVPLLMLFSLNRTVGILVGGYAAFPISYESWGNEATYFGANFGINLLINKLSFELRYYFPFTSGYTGWDHYFHSLTFIIGVYF